MDKYFPTDVFLCEERKYKPPTLPVSVCNVVGNTYIGVEINPQIP